MYYNDFRVKKSPHSSDDFIKPLVWRALCYGVALKPSVLLLKQSAHGSRAFERGGVCVVGEFVLAYLDYFTPFTSINQLSPPLSFDFSQNNDAVYKLIPKVVPFFHSLTEEKINCV
jgi:hypothetical protein